jgi:hypothetical protein
MLKNAHAHIYIMYVCMYVPVYHTDYPSQSCNIIRRKIYEIFIIYTREREPFMRIE